MQYSRRTIFTTPVLNVVLRGLSLLVLKLCGWRASGVLPADVKKAVFIAAPHTSNWDLPMTLLVAFALRLEIHWMGKEEIFKPPFRGLMMWLGGIPVNRDRANNLVAASAQAIVDADQPLQLVVPPEGTRQKTRYWKTGFYYIALSAKVPIVLAYMDYKRKISGLGPLFHPTGDIEADMVKIKAFYAGFSGKNALQFEAE